MHRCVKLPSLESANVDAEQCTVGLSQPQCQMVTQQILIVRILMSITLVEIWPSEVMGRLCQSIYLSVTG